MYKNKSYIIKTKTKGDLILTIQEEKDFFYITIVFNHQLINSIYVKIKKDKVNEFEKYIEEISFIPKKPKAINKYKIKLKDINNKSFVYEEEGKDEK